MAEAEAGQALQRALDALSSIYQDLSLLVTPAVFSEAKSAPKDRLAIIGKYRLYIFGMDGKIRHSYHLLDLKKVVSNEPTEVQLHFEKTVVSMRMDVVDDFIMFISSAFNAHFFTVFLKIEVTPESRIKRLPVVEPAPCGAFGETYRSICAYHNVPFREDLYWDITNIYSMNNVKDLNFAEFELSSMDFKILLMTFTFNACWFTGLRLKNCKLSDAQVQLVAEGLLRLEPLESLVMENNMNALKDSGLFNIATALGKGKNAALTHLNISNNGVDDRGCKQLGKALGATNYALQRIKLAGWQTVTPKAFGGFFQDLKKNPRIGLSLRSLNLSHSKLGDEGSAALAQFLMGANNLTELDVSNASASLETIAEALPIGCNNLSTLNFSGNRFNPAKPFHHMCSFLAATASLTALDLSNTQVGIEPLREILRSLISNLALPKINLNLADNKLGALAANLLSQVAGEFHNLDALDMTNTDLGDEGLTYLLEGLVNSRSLRSLKIGRNMRGQKTKERPQAIRSIIGLLESTCPLQSLSVEGSGKLSDLQLKADIHPLLLALSSTETLTSLDISGHAFGNKGAAILCKSLQVNSALRRLWLDENGVTLPGFQALALALERNDTLVYIAHSTHDLAAAIKAMGDDSKPLMKAMTDLERSLLMNHETFVARSLADQGLVDAPPENRNLTPARKATFRKSLMIGKESVPLAAVTERSSRGGANGTPSRHSATVRPSSARTETGDGHQRASINSSRASEAGQAGPLLAPPSPTNRKLSRSTSEAPVAMQLPSTKTSASEAPERTPSGTALDVNKAKKRRQKSNVKVSRRPDGPEPMNLGPAGT